MTLIPTCISYHFFGATIAEAESCDRDPANLRKLALYRKVSLPALKHLS